VPEATRAALEAWLAVHPLARGRGPRDEQPLFVRLGRFPGAQPPEPLSGQAVHKLVLACARARVRAGRWHRGAARAPARAAAVLGDVAARSRRADPSRLQPAGHADLRTIGRYAADHPDHADDIADVLDRRHEATRRARR